VPSELYARLCHAFLVRIFFSVFDASSMTSMCLVALSYCVYKIPVCFLLKLHVNYHCIALFIFMVS